LGAYCEDCERDVVEGFNVIVGLWCEVWIWWGETTALRCTEAYTTAAAPTPSTEFALR
jgi:hypothetical protein